jgi:hypothetical protein
LFARILGKVVELNVSVLKILDELPVAVTDGRARASSEESVLAVFVASVKVDGKVPEKRPILEFACSGEFGEQTDAIEFFV